MIQLIRAFMTAAVLLASGLPLAAQARARSVASPPSNKIDAELRAVMRRVPDESRWPDSPAVALLDTGKLTVLPGGWTVADYRLAFKLHNERARSYAEVSIPFVSSYQTVQVLQARTIKSSGKILNVKREDIRTTSSVSDYPLYDDAVALSFSMPGVEDGCIIDYTYRITSRPMMFAGQFWEKWYFSSQHPVLSSRYVMTVPSSVGFRFRSHNRSGLAPQKKVSADKKLVTYVWSLTNLDPIESEPEMPEMDEVAVWLEVSSIGSWDDIGRWFWKLAEPRLSPNDSIRATTLKLIAGKDTPEAKARAIYDWVANRVRYVGLEFGLSAFRPHPAPEVFANLYGDCKDKTALLIAMLRVAGIKAHPALLQADSALPVGTFLPTPYAFSHCIALATVNEKPVWLDPTSESCPYGDIPDSDRGAHALVVRGDRFEFREIPPYTADVNAADGHMTIDLSADSSATITLAIDFRGSYGQYMRGFARMATPEQRKRLATSFAQRISPAGMVKNSDFPDGQSKVDPFTLKITVHAPDYARKVGDLLVVPTSPEFANGDENPFTKEKRTYPIVTRTGQKTTGTIIFRVPEGYVVQEMPEDAEIRSPLFDFTLKYERSPDGRTITIVETSIEKPARVPPSQYGAIQSHYTESAKRNRDHITLRKADAVK